jgi:short-subunit dehydrogenase
MSIHLKSLDQQVIVITGASSGIGLATAKLAAARGACVVLSSRNEAELNKVVSELNQKFGKKRRCAIAVVADVADANDVQKIADTTIREFGGFDTWVNNAGVSIYGKLWDTPLIEKRRLFDVNFWGVVHGCRSALKHLRNKGGAIINVGSAVSERTVLIQGIYSASKHAVKAYTDALRMEAEEAGFPVSVTLIRPASIDTPWTEHARNHMPFQPELPAPVYAAEVVADAILTCACKPRRDVFVGGAAKAFSILEHYAPRLTDKFMEKKMVEQQQNPNKQRTNNDSLFSPPAHEGETSGHRGGPIMRSSAYTSFTLNPVRSLLLSAIALGGLGALWFLNNRSSGERDIHQRDLAMARTMSGTVTPSLH